MNDAEHEQVMAALQAERDEVSRLRGELKTRIAATAERTQLDGAEIARLRGEIEWLQQRYVELVDHSEAEVSRLRNELDEAHQAGDIYLDRIAELQGDPERVIDTSGPEWVPADGRTLPKGGNADPKGKSWSADFGRRSNE